MNRALVYFALICAFFLQGCATHSTTSAEKRQRETEARMAALQWLQLVDNENYQAAYRREAARLRTATTFNQFKRSMKGRRAPFGCTLSRKFIGAAFTHKLTGSPDGNYESILFRTSFEQKAVAAERVILSNEEHQWRIVDYRVY